MRPLRSYRVSALVLRTRDMGEADRLMTLLSPERGKIAALAKGARRPRSKLASLQLFSLATLQMAAGKNLDIVTQAVIQLPFLNIRSDYIRFTYASYFSELADALIEPGEANRRLFELLASAFSLLDRGFDPALTARAFELHALDLSGYAPQLEECLDCDRPLGTEPMGFSPSLGGIVCAGCAQSRTGLVMIREETRRGLLIMRQIRRITELPDINLSFSPAAKAEMERLLRTQITYHLEERIRSLDAVSKLKS